MKFRNLALFPALVILVLAGIATAAGGYRTAYQPNGTGLFHVVGGVQALDASTLQVIDVAGDASTGWAPLVLADGGVGWGAVSGGGGITTLAGDVTGDAGSNTVVAIQGHAVSSSAPGQYQVLMGTYGGAGTYTPYTVGPDVTATGTGAPVWSVGTAANGCFSFAAGGVLTLGKAASSCSGNQSIATLASTASPGNSLSVSAGSTTGATGGALFLSSGSGASAGGAIELLPSGSTAQGINYTPAGTWQWFNTATAPGFTQAAATAASGSNLTFAAQSSTTAGGTASTGVGGYLVFQAGSGSYASGNVQIFSGSLKMIDSGWNSAFNTQGTVFNSTGVYGRALSIWNSGASSSVYTFGSTDGSNGYLFRDATASNATSPANVYTNAVTSQHLAVALNDVIAMTSTAVKVSQPIVADSVASPYTVHGYGSVSVAGGSAVTLSAGTYANHYIDLTGAITANITVTLPAGNGAEWCIGNGTTGNFTITLKDVGDTGAGVALTTPGVTSPTFCKRVYSDGTRLRTAE